MESCLLRECLPPSGASKLPFQVPACLATRLADWLWYACVCVAYRGNKGTAIGEGRSR